MKEGSVRIFSDLHFGENASRLQSLDALRPLLDGAGQVIVNGDALDTQGIPDGPGAIAEVKTFFAAHTPRATFITGNHDPDISDLHEISLAERSIWVTHGDVLFEDIAPWSRIRPEIRRRLKNLGKHLSASERAHIETRLKLHRQACLKLPVERDIHARGALRRFTHLARVATSPQQAFNVWRVWLTTPSLGARLAAAQRKDARFVILGHTHSPGVWTRPDGRVVINTGSFCPPRGARLVEIDEGKLRVHRVVQRDKMFHADSVVAEFPLAQTAVYPLTAVV